MWCEDREWRHNKRVHYVSIIWNQKIKLLASTNTECASDKTKQSSIDWEEKKKERELWHHQYSY